MIKLIKKLLFISILFIPNIAFAETSCDSSTTSEKIICEIGMLLPIVETSSYLIGSILAVLAVILAFENQKDSRRVSLKAVMLTFLSATLLIMLPQILTVAQSTIFPDGNLYSISDYNSTLSRINESGAQNLSMLTGHNIRVVFAFVKLISVIVVVKGIYLIYVAGRWGDSSANQGIYIKILIHILGGAISFNLEDIMCVFGDFINVQSMCLVS